MKKIIFVLLMFILCFGSLPVTRVNAATLNDKYKELEELKAKKEATEKSKNLTEAEISKIKKEINELQIKMDNTLKEIQKANQDIVDTEAQIKEKEVETKELIKFLQLTTGSNVYLEYLFEADSYTDFVYRYSVVTQLSEYNSKLMDELDALVKKLEQSKIDSNNKNEQYKKEVAEKNKKNNSLGSELSNIQKEGTTIDEDIRDLKKEISDFENIYKCGKNEDTSKCVVRYFEEKAAKEAADKEASQNISSLGFRYPLTKGYVSSGYGYRCFSLGCDFHYGVDIAGNPEGTPVYPIANGLVARIIYRGSCGGNQVFLYHVVNGSTYTSSYLHLQSYTVSVGQVVTDTTVLGYVGGGASTPWDSCSTGAHMHLGMAYGQSANTFFNNSFNPVLVFPRLTIGASFSSR